VVRITAAQPLALRRRGSAAEAEAKRPTSGAAAEGRLGPHAGRIWPVLVGCLALSALSLLFPSTPTYDPWAWIMWGREIAHLDLVTEGGPSWKPLPVLFTTPFSLFGAEVAPYLWLWIARAGALLALAMAFRLARRLAGGGTPGVIAGLVAALFLATTYQFVRDSMLGNSEAMLGALVLWAFERHLDGRRDHALYLGLGAALLRPEAWPFFGAYGLWLWFREPQLRVRVACAAMLIPLLWFGAELWGSGDWLRASNRATNPNTGAATFAEHPGFEVVKRFHQRTVIPLEAAALLAVGLAARAWIRERREQAVLFLAGGAAAWILLVAFMTEGGYAGNQRYLIVTTVAICVLGGIGVARAFQFVMRVASERLPGDERAQLVAAGAILVLGVAALSPVISDKVHNTDVTLDILRYEASLWHNLPDIIEKGGGSERLLACGAIHSGPFQTQMLAYEMGLHGRQVRAIGGVPPSTTKGRPPPPPRPAPGVVFRTHTRRTSPLVPRLTDDRFRLVARNQRWRLVTAPRSDARGRDCPAGEPDSPRVPPRRDTPELTSSR
jgi:hypothetical protein